MSDTPEAAAAPESLRDRIKEAADSFEDSFEDAVELIFNEAIALVRDPASAHVSTDSIGTRLEKLRDSITGRNQEAPAADTIIVGQPDTESTEAASSPAAEETPPPPQSESSGQASGGGEAEGSKESPESTREQSPSELGTTAS